MSNIEITAGINVGNIVAYSARITSTFSGLFQHVAWNVLGEGLTNLSGCSTGLSDNTTTAINVHSSVINASYPSYLVVHSVSAETSTIAADVFDAETGVRVGGVVFTNVPSYATGVLDIALLESRMGYVPSPTQYHYNVVLTGNTAAYITHQVDNVSAGMITNMTGACTL
jgi:hypothetical protein